MFYIRFFYLKNERIAYSLFFGERCEWFTLVAHQKWAMWANRSEEMSNRERIAQVAHQKWANEWIARFFERIAHSLNFRQKTSDSLGKPMSEYPTMLLSWPSYAGGGLGGTSTCHTCTFTDADHKSSSLVSHTVQEKTFIGRPSIVRTGFTSIQKNLTIVLFCGEK